MPENPNPYMDPNMNPNGFMPSYGQPGYVDETNPYAQQPGWDQAQYGMPGQGYPGMPQADMFVEDYLNPGNMASPQDIYANQAAQMGGMPGQYGAPFADPNAGFMDPNYAAMGGQPFSDPYSQNAQQGFYGQPSTPGAQPFFDPMQQGQMPGQPGQLDPSQAGMPYGAPGQTGQQAPVSPSQTGGFDNPMQAAQQGVTEPQVPGGMPQPADAAQTAAMGAQGQSPLQQVPVGQQQAQQAQQPQPGQQAKGKKGQKAQPQAQAQPQAKAVAMPARHVDPSKATKGRATLALILSILSIVLALIPPVGLVLSIVARKIAKSYKKNGGHAGSGDAAAVFSLVGIVFSIATCALLVWFIGYVNGALIGSKAYMNPISFFNNSPLGMLFKIPT